MTRVYISPSYRAPDRGDGGIRRVVEAQRRWLPDCGVNVVDYIGDADVAAFHAGVWETPPPGMPVVAHTHGLYWDEYEWPRWAQQVNNDVIRTLKQADASTAPSEWVAHAIRRGMWADPIVMHHGIDPDDWPLGTSQGYVLWNKSRVDAICNPAPVTELASRADDVKFVTTFVRAGGERNNIEVFGQTTYEQQRRLVAGAGVYLATARETFGIGTLEAMCAGVPVLGFEWGGQPEVITHGQNGYLVHPGDYDALAEGLRYCLEHRERLGLAAREFVLGNYTWQQRIQPYAALYTQLAQDAKSRREHQTPKVSVVITNYNLGRYLEEAVVSVEGGGLPYQTEIVIVDDASTDPADAHICDDLVNAGRVRLIKNESNLYLAEALNVGISRARGEYILPLDADNKVAPGAIKLLADALDADRGLDIAYGQMSVFVDDSVKGYVSSWPPAVADLSAQVQNKNQITSTALYRRKVWSGVGGYRRRCRTAEDADFWTRALAVGFEGRRVTDAVTLVYRDRPDSMSHINQDWPWSAWYGWATGKDRLVTRGGPIRIHDNPLISVVIPVGLGHERYVLDALDSLQAQSFASWEALVVNDTGGMLPWVHTWAYNIRGSGGGVSRARNLGIDAARGEHVLFLDADDYLHPDALYHMYHTAVSSTCPKTFVYTDWFIAETGERRSVSDFRADDVLERLPYPVTCLYKRSDLLSNNLRFDPTLVTGWEDWDFSIQAVVKAGLCGVRVAAPLLHYRIGTGTLRATAAANKTTIKDLIKAKWSDYVTGGAPMPGSCGGCGGGRYPSLMSAVVDTSVFAGINLDTETSLLQYNPPPEWTGARSFIGRATGNRYKFSADGDGRIRRVYNADLDGLVALGFFEVINGGPGQLVPLQAVGPPVRDREHADAAV